MRESTTISTIRGLSIEEIGLVSGGVDMTGWSEAEIAEYYELQASKSQTPFSGGGSSVSGVTGEKSDASRLP